MARRAGGSEDQPNIQEDWEWLLEDMIRLSGDSNNGRKSAFGLLSHSETVHIFFSGLLSTGRGLFSPLEFVQLMIYIFSSSEFDIAQSFLRSPKNRQTFDSTQIEEICLSCSREFYDNASSGNYKFGDMKLAYGW
jgi:hypothetical protein